MDLMTWLPVAWLLSMRLPEPRTLMPAEMLPEQLLFITWHREPT